MLKSFGLRTPVVSRLRGVWGKYCLEGVEQVADVASPALLALDTLSLGFFPAPDHEHPSYQRVVAVAGELGGENDRERDGDGQGQRNVFLLQVITRASKFGRDKEECTKLNPVTTRPLC